LAVNSPAAEREPEGFCRKDISSSRSPLAPGKQSAHL